MWLKDLYKIKYDYLIIELDNWSHSKIYLEVLKAHAHQGAGEQKSSTAFLRGKEELRDGNNNKNVGNVRFEGECLPRSYLWELVMRTARTQWRCRVKQGSSRIGVCLTQRHPLLVSSTWGHKKKLFHSQWAALTTQQMHLHCDKRISV